MNAVRKAVALAQAGQGLGVHGAVAAEILARLEQGRLAALDVLQDRFCVCMKQTLEAEAFAPQALWKTAESGESCELRT